MTYGDFTCIYLHAGFKHVAPIKLINKYAKCVEHKFFTFNLNGLELYYFLY